MQFLKAHWWKFVLIVVFFCAVWFPAYSCGSDSGYIDGHAAGVSEGHEKGYSEGHDAGVSEGHEKGYSEGHAEGYDAGYLVGFDEGRTGAPSEENAAFIGNAKSHIFHSPKCGSLPYKENRVYFVDRQSALDSGYHACSHCKP